MKEEKGMIQFRSIPSLKSIVFSLIDEASLMKEKSARLYCGSRVDGGGASANLAFVSLVERIEHRELAPVPERRANVSGAGAFGDLACVSLAGKKDDFAPTAAQLLNHPLAALAYVPRDAGIFASGAIAGAVSKTVAAPLDRLKLLMQSVGAAVLEIPKLSVVIAHGVRAGQQSVRKAIGFIEAISMIAKEEGIKGYWKGNLPQVIPIIPYSAVQLFAYENYKKLFKGKDDELSVIGRLAAGACAGMTSTFVRFSEKSSKIRSLLVFLKITYPLDVLRLRLAVEPGYRTMS